MVMYIINEGYKNPFINEPPPMFLNNNKSALLEYVFVTESIIELLSSNRITEKHQPSYIASPLSVAYQASGKKRLINDLSRLNTFVNKIHSKLDDWKIELQYLSKDALMFTFDLKSGYHHIDISPEYQRFLGFPWTVDGVKRYFEFNVLPFGLTSASLLFTKMVKPLVTHWRASGILIALYLDDGFIVISKATDDAESNRKIAQTISKHVRVDLLKAGLVYNIEKINWDPTTRIEWLGMIWDTKTGILQVLDRRIDKLKKTMSEIQLLQIVSIRKLHSFVGQIISLSPVSGNITRLMTRHCQIQIAKATEEDEMINLDVQCKSELSFWKENLNQLNKCKVFETHNVNKIICCDASATGSGAIICNDIHIAHKLCTEIETMQSSTWRELNTIQFTIKSFIPIIADSQLKIFTDSQAAARVVEVGSMKIELQKMALDIFTTCTRNNIRLEVQWIPRKENEQAHFISRLIDKMTG